MHFKLKFYVLQKRSTAFYVFRNIWKGAQENKSKSIATPLHKSLVHPHLGNYVLLFPALKWNRTRKKLRIKMIKGTQAEEAFRCSRVQQRPTKPRGAWERLTRINWQANHKGPWTENNRGLGKHHSYSNFTPPILAAGHTAQTWYRDGHLVWACTSAHTGRCPEKMKHWESLTGLCLITTIIKA